MEAIGLAASLTTLVKHSHGILVYFEDVRNTPKEMAELALELAPIHRQLQFVKALEGKEQQREIEESEQGLPSYTSSLLAPVTEVVLNIRKELEWLSKELATQSSHFRKVKKQMLWHMDKSKVQACLSKVHRMKLALAVILQQVLVVKSDEAILKLDRLQSAYDQDEYRNIQTWLTRTDYRAQQQRDLAIWSQGTCLWVIQSEEYTM